MQGARLIFIVLLAMALTVAGHDKGCVFGDTSYPNGAFIEDTCLIMKCCDGIWKYTGRINPWCLPCTVTGDPHIIPFDEHTWSDTLDPGKVTVSDAGYFTITQYPGITNIPEFEVNSVFIACPWSSSVACIHSVTYYEPGIEIFLKLTDLGNAIQVSVDGLPRSIGNTVASFQGTDGNALVFQDDPIGSGLTCMNIVGSKGLSVSLCLEDYAWISIRAWPSLKYRLNGLCDTFTETTPAFYTERDGSRVYETDPLGLKPFIDSWKIGPDGNTGKRSTSAVEEYHHNRVRREVNNVGRCKNETELIDITNQCQNITTNPDICGFILLEWWCHAMNASCVFDLCRVPDPDEYAHGYSTQMLIEANLTSTACCPPSYCGECPCC